MNTKRILAVGITAAAIAMGSLAGSASAETRTFPYGTYGQLKYDGVSASQRGNTFKHNVARTSAKTSTFGFSISTEGRKQNFGTSKRQPRIISR